jgi:hypothetical protein
VSFFIPPQFPHRTIKRKIGSNQPHTQCQLFPLNFQTYLFTQNWLKPNTHAVSIIPHNFPTELLNAKKLYHAKLAQTNNTRSVNLPPKKKNRSNKRKIGSNQTPHEVSIINPLKKKTGLFTQTGSNPSKLAGGSTPQFRTYLVNALSQIQINSPGALPSQFPTYLVNAQTQILQSGATYLPQFRIYLYFAFPSQPIHGRVGLH